MAKNPLRITDTILRDAHQSQAATRMRIEDMLPACEKLDNMGYWSLECWGGATFDVCMRFLNEDPWERLRTLKKAMPKTPLQMLLRGQNLLGYKHYADDVVAEFCKKSIENGIDVVRIFDALNDPHYRDNRLDTAAVDQVVQQFGYDRAFHILAITVCQADWDKRYSPDNRAWANAMSIPANPDAWGTDRNCYLAVNSHPGLVDLFLSQTRKAYAQEQQKTSVRDKLKKPPETTSPKISAKSKAPER